MTKIFDLPTEEQMLAVVPKPPDPTPHPSDDLIYGDPTRTSRPLAAHNPPRRPGFLG